MSTKNDKTSADLVELSRQLLIDFNGIEELSNYWFSHSRRQIEKEFKEKYNCSYYYAKQVFNNIFKFRDRSPEEFVIIQHNNMNKTNMERYGRTNLGQFGTDEHNEAIKNKYNVENISQAEVIKEKIKLTNLKKYGVASVLSNETIRKKIEQTNLIKYGTINVMQAESVKEKSKQTCLKKYGTINGGWTEFTQEKIKQTNLKKYGVEYFGQSIYHLNIAHKKYFYDNIYFDSSWELALWIFAKDHGEEIVRCPISFEYTVNTKKHYYFPDFKYLGKLIEIKGNQFLNKNNELKSCYCTDNEDKIKAKYECMINNNVEIWSKAKIQFALDYIKKVYGKDYLKQFKMFNERKK